ncbi:chemotaxis protein CheB [Thioflexithrix psekupsensis]|uniref:protein-glutamate methylesterase n=1 Tax=Thioflexithrix psekupsensis TaxID=1570016 RepID=A0A251X6K2_9GAMM|nr:chemotaxis protein CheB [Thioflexithrix psekupsensis]OUD13091.1 chemotaxis protein CheB [Thioflexithrix psekupsensis]
MKENTVKTFKAIVMGASAGGIKALGIVLSAFPKDFPVPVLIVQHLHPNSDSYLIQMLAQQCALTVKQADEKELIHASTVYIAPPNYHLLVEEDYSLSLSVDPRVNFSRPAIDVLFETAAYAYRDQLIGVILTGANGDGSQGVKLIRKLGGYLVVQDPATAEAEAMPRAAISAVRIDRVLPLEQIGPYLVQLINRGCQL